MSHVDEGTLHAYLDGELTPVEVGRLESHLAGCAACRARLDEERALIERAARLLDAAVPPGPARAAPPLHQLRRSRSGWRKLQVPLAWAATIVLALGLGWYGGSLRMGRITPEQPATPVLDAVRAPVSQAKTPSTPAEAAGGRLSKDGEQAEPPAPTAIGALADRPAREESDERQAASAAERLPSSRAQPGLRRVAPPAPVADNAIVAMQEAPAAVARGVASYRLSSTWPVIAPQPARDLLGAAPATIPGYVVRALRRNPSMTREVVVEQEIAGVVVSLFERPIDEDREGKRADAQAPADSLAARARANERLARFVGELRVEISGPLPMDSLSKLLELIRP